MIPENNHANASETLARGSRRTFLRRSLATGVVVAPALALRTTPARAAGHPRIPSLFPGQTERYFAEIRSDEDAHVEILQALLNDPDNPLTPAIRPAPTLRNLEQPNFMAFVAAAAAFENTGSGGYAGALFATQQTLEYFPTAAGITTVEARHAAFLNTLLNEPSLVPSFAPVESPIDQSVILSRVDPFIAQLNAPVPSFNPTMSSDANNFAILDFLLLLEYIESAFYDLNVKKFFPGA
jgi:hypothetical protein